MKALVSGMPAAAALVSGAARPGRAVFGFGLLGIGASSRRRSA